MKRQVPCYRKAVELLARRSHFERELEAKLVRRGYGEEEVAATLGRLRGEDLLDDPRTAREFVRGRLARGPVGAARLRAELERRGVDSELAREALAHLLPDDDLELARDAAERWRRRARRPTREALARHLERKGFSRRAIVSVLREVEE